MNRKPSGFTIVELLVVIIIIGILAAITIVAYTGISQKAVASSLQSDLSNSSTLLKMYYIDYGSYPTTLNTNYCPEGPTIDNKYCLKASTGNTFFYTSNNSTNPPTFTLTAAKTSASLAYYVTKDSSPTTIALARTSEGIPKNGLATWHDLYDPTQNLQVIPDYSGNSNTLQRGPSSGAESADPSWQSGGKGLGFTGVNYAVTGNLTGVTMAGDWTIIFCLTPSGITGINLSLSMNSGDQWAMVQGYGGSGRQTRVIAKRGGTWVGGSSWIVVEPGTSTLVFAMQKIGTTVTLTRLDTGANVSYTDSLTGSAASMLLLGGEYGGSTLVNNMTAFADGVWIGSLQTAQLASTYMRLQHMWASRGVTLTDSSSGPAIITVTGLPAGSSVVASDGTNTAAANTSGGTASPVVKMLGYPLTNISTYRGINGTGALIGQITSSIYSDMGGGDSYQYTGGN